MSWFSIEHGQNGPVLHLRGVWRMSHLPEILKALDAERPLPMDRGVLDGSELEEIDTAGALIVFKRLLRQGISAHDLELVNVSQAQHNILELVAGQLRPPTPLRATPTDGIIGGVGRSTLRVGTLIYDYLSFFGHSLVELTLAITTPHRIRGRELFAQLEIVGVNAIPIVALVNFLIGVVIAYLFGIQIEKYGANIFIVNAVAIAMCRELSPILVAIIIAGRSGSAFTAQIGTMKLNEEIDAMRVFGLSPMRVLVVPRIIALVLTMPLLVFVGDVVGIIGSMCVADVRLGVTAATFIERLRTVLPLRHVFVGLGKAPVYATVIAMIGCRMGFATENNARSVGLNTTSTVVQSIVAVILLNAAFAVLLMELGL